jgi:hypothetical protein
MKTLFSDECSNNTFLFVSNDIKRKLSMAHYIYFINQGFKFTNCMLCNVFTASPSTTMFLVISQPVNIYGTSSCNLQSRIA